MREIRCLFQLILRTISNLRQVAGFVYTFLSAFFSSRTTLAVRVLAAESQLDACKHRIVEKDRPRTRHELDLDHVLFGVSGDPDRPDNINYIGIVPAPSLANDFSHPVCTIAGADGVSAISAALPAVP